MRQRPLTGDLTARYSLVADFYIKGVDMKWFLQKIMAGIGIGMGIIISLAIFQIGYVEYLKYSKEKLPASGKTDMNTVSAEGPVEISRSERIEVIYDKADRYRNGFGVDKNHRLAAELYLEAADMGHTQSQVQLAYMYRDGFGVNQDYVESVKWLERAAGSGNKQAVGSLGYMYLKGWGVERNYRRAYEMLLEAAEAGHAFAMGNIGYMHQKGLYVERSSTLAREWYEKGASNGDDYSVTRLRDGW